MITILRMYAAENKLHVHTLASTKDEFRVHKYALLNKRYATDAPTVRQILRVAVFSIHTVCFTDHFSDLQYLDSVPLDLMT